MWCLFTAPRDNNQGFTAPRFTSRHQSQMQILSRKQKCPASYGQKQNLPQNQQRRTNNRQIKTSSHRFTLSPLQHPQVSSSTNPYPVSTAPNYKPYARNSSGSELHHRYPRKSPRPGSTSHSRPRSNPHLRSRRSRHGGMHRRARLDPDMCALLRRNARGVAIRAPEMAAVLHRAGGASRVSCLGRKARSRAGEDYSC